MRRVLPGQADHVLLADIFLPTESEPTQDDSTDEEILSLGAIKPGTPFLKKPFSSDSLIRKVREVLNVTR